MTSEPIVQLLEQEKKDEDYLISVAMSKYKESLAKTNILLDMEELLQQETEKFRLLHQDRTETIQSILEQ